MPAAAESARLCRGRAADQQQVHEVEAAGESASAAWFSWSNMDSSRGVSSSSSSSMKPCSGYRNAPV